PSRSRSRVVHRVLPGGRGEAGAPRRRHGLSPGARVRRRLPGHPELLRRGGMPAMRVRRAPGAAAPGRRSRAPTGRPELAAGHRGRRDGGGPAARMGDLDLRGPGRRGPRPSEARGGRSSAGRDHRPV
ncbi:MAG: hypothetical protein AVDCRST_MAG24-657, partial [uncultured Nocardioidaceae bacterium]